MISITVNATGLDKALSNLDGLAARINKPAVLVRRMGEAVMEDIDQRYMTQGRGTWPALKPETVKRKGNSFILIETGAMYASTRMAEITDTSVTVDVPYGGRNHAVIVPLAHQKGTRVIPQRRIIASAAELMPMLRGVLAHWLEQITQAGAVDV